jgi:hypothetical protein
VRLGFSRRCRHLGPGRAPLCFGDHFRILERLVPQIVRVLKTEQLGTITDDVVKAAASVLVIGTSDTKLHKTPPPNAETP